MIRKLLRKLLVALIWKNPLSPYGKIPSRRLVVSFLFILAILLTAYAPSELTRVIITSWHSYGLVDGIAGETSKAILLGWNDPGFLPQWIFEIAFIWVLYLAGMFLVWRLIKVGRE